MFEKGLRRKEASLRLPKEKRDLSISFDGLT
jgi:hypothetical protein